MGTVKGQTSTLEFLFGIFEGDLHL